MATISKMQFFESLGIPDVRDAAQPDGILVKERFELLPLGQFFSMAVKGKRSGEAKNDLPMFSYPLLVKVGPKTALSIRGQDVQRIKANKKVTPRHVRVEVQTLDLTPRGTMENKGMIEQNRLKAEKQESKASKLRSRTTPSTTIFGDTAFSRHPGGTQAAIDTLGELAHKGIVPGSSPSHTMRADMKEERVRIVRNAKPKEAKKEAKKGKGNTPDSYRTGEVKAGSSSKSQGKSK